jgi:hypothetical protein
VVIKVAKNLRKLFLTAANKLNADRISYVTSLITSLTKSC